PRRRGGWLMSSAPAVWCPACGAEYTIGSRYCNECRVELVVEPPPGADGGADMIDDDEEVGDATDLVELGEFPSLHAQILRARLDELRTRLDQTGGDT